MNTVLECQHIHVNMQMSILALDPVLQVTGHVEELKMDQHFISLIKGIGIL